MTLIQPCVAFIPLSNWLRGFDRYAMRYSKVEISESRWPGRFFLLREDESPLPGLRKVRGLIRKLGVKDDRVVALRTKLPVGDDALRPNDVTGTKIGWHWPQPEIPLSAVAWVGEDNELIETRHEEVTAQAFRLHDDRLLPWSECAPRTISILPVAKACQARCAFCFSRASVSELVTQRAVSLDVQSQWALAAKARGAERAVITGGGEPLLAGIESIAQLALRLRALFPKVVLITNGAMLKQASDLTALAEAGLTTLAISRHGLDPDSDARVMGLPVDSARVAAMASKAGLRTRAITVLQRGAVDSVENVIRAVQRCAAEGFDEVCFKELYVSSIDENPWAPGRTNAWCSANQVSLRIVIEAMRQLGFSRSSSLPWGSPVFTGVVSGRSLCVAAYTEPSVGWERTHGLVRSWNLLADGTCLASLEDPASRVALDR